MNPLRRFKSGQTKITTYGVSLAQPRGTERLLTQNSHNHTDSSGPTPHHEEVDGEPRPVDIPRRPIAEFVDVVGLARTVRLLDAAARFRRLAAGRVIWTLSSTATGGGVSEMLRGLVGYTRDLAIDIRWFIIGGDADFFRITKRLHNHIHGQPGDAGPLGPREERHFTAVAGHNLAALREHIRPGDLVLLHDPQTAALIGPLAAAGAHVVWRCHIGADRQNEHTRTAWDFLRPHLDQAEACVFSHDSYAPDFLPEPKVWVIPPSIDPFSPKNQDLTTETVHAILAEIGVLAGVEPRGPGHFTRRDGTPGVVVHPAAVVAQTKPGPDDPLVVQISRWDRLKDMSGVMRAFTDHVAPTGDGFLVLAGPAVEGVADDPEGALVFTECLAQWQALPSTVRDRIMLVTLPMIDVDENGAMVNALQRQARVITQKSLAEGFGLTVSEGMWKGRAVVGSAVGGIVDQINPDVGVLLADPTDLAAFGAVVRGLLDEPDRAARLGAAARGFVRDHFVGDLHLLRYAQLFATLVNG